MAPASQDSVSHRRLRREVRDVGNRLLELPSSTDELLILLEEAERTLAKVWQEPSVSMSDALRVVMKALITDQILRHTDVDIQVAVASCFNEISRITAPTFPYPDDYMKEFFKLVLTTFKQMACETGRNYCRALEILETVAKTKSSLVMLEIDSEGLTVEMFQIFLDSIRSDHPSDVFENMETIMTLVVDECDEISFELLNPLLDSVRTANKDTSPIAWKLGKKIFENCATKLQPYVRESVKSKNLDLNDYDDIVTSICQDASSGRNMIQEFKSPQVGYGEELVNSRVKVWWPLDKTYYTGTIKSFDPDTKKHEILYDDDMIEVLNLNEEKWELIDDQHAPKTQPSQREEAIHPSPFKEPVETQEKTTGKRNKRSSKKRRDAAAPSSSRKKAKM